MSKKRKKGLTTKNTHIPKRVTKFVDSMSKKVSKFTDGDIAVLQTKLLTASDDELWNEFTYSLSQGLYLPMLEKYRIDYFTDKPHLDKPITNIECMLIGVTMMSNDDSIKTEWVKELRKVDTMLPFTMAQLLRMISDLRSSNPNHLSMVKRIEESVNWEK